MTSQKGSKYQPELFSFTDNPQPVSSHKPSQSRNIRYFTKSKFKSALECPKKLYYYGKKKEYSDRNMDNDFLLALAKGGFQVGELARQYYPSGIMNDSLDYSTSLSKTEELLKKDNVIIFEAALLYKGCFLRADILKKHGKYIDLIEVKSKSWDNEKDSFKSSRDCFLMASWRPYLYDVAYQTWVISSIFPNKIVTPYLMLMDKVKLTTVDGLNQHFKLNKNNSVDVSGINSITDLGSNIMVDLDVTEEVEMILTNTDCNEKFLDNNPEYYKPFDTRVLEYADYYIKDKPFDTPIGHKCKSCQYKSTPEEQNQGLKSGYEECWLKKAGKGFDSQRSHIFDLWKIANTDELIRSRKYYLEDIREDYTNPNSKSGPRQQIQLDYMLDKKEYIDHDLKGIMKKWKFPLHFIDFETAMAAIPFYKKRHAYEEIAFQFSCHTLYSDGTLKHEEYINKIPGRFPNFEFLKALKLVLDKDEGTIFRYANHENSVLRHIRQQLYDMDRTDELDSRYNYSELTAFIDTITRWKINKKDYRVGKRSMVDLQLLVKDHYYHYVMKGSNSIKYVLPAVLTASKYLKEKYSNPLEDESRLNGYTLYTEDINGVPENPYKQLPSVFGKLDTSSVELISDEEDTLADGGAAMTAYCACQFANMSNLERDTIFNALLRYCCLDTLAMVMIYEHWDSILF